MERWASDLITVHVVHISSLNEAEARQLIQQPITDFPLSYHGGARQRVLELTRGHPCLVQLLCAGIIADKNEQPLAARRSVHLGDVEAAMPRTLASGHLFFADIQRNQVDSDALALLRWLAARGEGAVASREGLDRSLDLLLRRELIERADGDYCLQVELIGRWIAQGIA